MNSYAIVPDFVPSSQPEVGCRADTEINCPGSDSIICEVVFISQINIFTCIMYLLSVIYLTIRVSFL